MGELFEHFKDYDLPAARKKAQEEGFREGHNKGHEEGRQAGEELLLIKLVCKKLAKNKEATQIAAELEVNETDVQRICLAAKKFAPEYDPEQIQYALNNTDD